MLQNKPSGAKFGFDTAENGPSKVWVTRIPVRTPPVPVKPKLRAVPSAIGIHRRVEGDAIHGQVQTFDGPTLAETLTEAQGCLVLKAVAGEAEVRERREALRSCFEILNGLLIPVYQNPDAVRSDVKTAD